MKDNQKPGKNGFKFPQQMVKTRITEVKPNYLSTRGYDQEDLITNLSFAEMVFLILRERLPDEREAKMFNHILVSFCDHGVTPPSTQSARLIASSGATINNAVAGGLLSFGKNHAGAIAKRIPGYGHRYHSKDPRAVRLLDLAILESSIGPHTKLALVIESILSERKGICLNVDGANAGLLCDLGFDSSLGLGIFMIGRLPGLVAHAYEEMEEEEKFRRFCDLEDIVYEGFKNRNIDDNFDE